MLLARKTAPGRYGPNAIPRVAGAKYATIGRAGRSCANPRGFIGCEQLDIDDQQVGPQRSTQQDLRRLTETTIDNHQSGCRRARCNNGIAHVGNGGSAGHLEGNFPVPPVGQGLHLRQDLEPVEHAQLINRRDALLDLIGHGRIAVDRTGNDAGTKSGFTGGDSAKLMKSAELGVGRVFGDVIGGNARHGPISRVDEFHRLAGVDQTVGRDIRRHPAHPGLATVEQLGGSAPLSRIAGRWA